MSSTWKDILKIVVTNLVAALYAFLADLPDFPDISLKLFVALFLWVVGILVGGWQVKRIYDRFRSLYS